MGIWDILMGFHGDFMGTWDIFMGFHRDILMGFNGIWDFFTGILMGCVVSDLADGWLSDENMAGPSLFLTVPAT